MFSVAIINDTLKVLIYNCPLLVFKNTHARYPCGSVGWGCPMHIDFTLSVSLPPSSSLSLFL